MSLYIGKDNKETNIIHYTKNTCTEQLLTTVDNIVNSTIFNSSLGVYVIESIEEEVIPNVDMFGDGDLYKCYPDTGKTYKADTAPLVDDTLIFILYKIDDKLYTKADLLKELGVLLTIYNSYNPDTPEVYLLTPTNANGFSFALQDTTITSIIITCKHTYFPKGPIVISNGVITIGGVSIRDNQILLYNEANSIDTTYKTSSITYSLLNSKINSTYPFTALSEDGIYAYTSDNAAQVPIIPANSYLHANSTDLVKIVDLHITKYQIPNPDNCTIQLSVGIYYYYSYSDEFKDLPIHIILDGTEREYPVMSYPEGESDESSNAYTIRTFSDYSIELCGGFYNPYSGCSDAFNRAETCFEYPLYTMDEKAEIYCDALGKTAAEDYSERESAECYIMSIQYRFLSA